MGGLTNVGKTFTIWRLARARFSLAAGDCRRFPVSGQFFRNDSTPTVLGARLSVIREGWQTRSAPGARLVPSRAVRGHRRPELEGRGAAGDQQPVRTPVDCFSERAG